ncbi:hypothetical protein FB45DRAFT_1005552 [Roridomyces roridus]|uniref:Uncharacterized protein n=1 Tax=Roridomyces roridus TaxID=1738132 RepID=A0AAD7BLK4_9AGAR|nr:hypothetical protein FB45DRAFT_1005552 [Roridomyces roridus]
MPTGEERFDITGWDSQGPDRPRMLPLRAKDPIQSRSLCTNINSLLSIQTKSQSEPETKMIFWYTHLGTYGPEILWVGRWEINSESSPSDLARSGFPASSLHICTVAAAWELQAGIMSAWWLDKRSNFPTLIEAATGSDVHPHRAPAPNPQKPELIQVFTRRCGQKYGRRWSSWLKIRNVGKAGDELHYINRPSLTDIKQQRRNNLSLKLPTKPPSPVQTNMYFNRILSSIIALAVTLTAATPVAEPKGSLDVRVEHGDTPAPLW